ncbi:SusC/RagA family TonB-linked outer membrane protein [Butyricimonas paravirosa]|uniref:SusC/RagA family TonB-linked outer membrane protein n=2 Tax=Bacteria TaxID=2 RepID=UPI00210DD58A|nr:SusC/RagA family TonB-linked outer membrane protein [Butyricimonas paravirosa]MCQ4872967.1 SusC/RagA family TonB-linked outer membrane protein [Butyricimonas paravirosa]
MRKKIEKVMKLFWILMCVFTFSVSANTLAQQERVSLDLKDVAMRTLFDEIQRQTSLYFVFNTELTDRLGLLSVSVKGETVENVLKQVLKGTGLTFKFRDDLIVIQQEIQDNVKKGKRVVGIVLDRNTKEPLPGVTVKLCSEASVTMGTATNHQGRFELMLPVTKGVLEFSFIGFENQKVNFTEKTDSLRVMLWEKMNELEDVVVTGYQQIDRRHLTAAVTTLKMDDIDVPGVNRIDLMLEGRIPGMTFMQNSGQVGATPKLRIRGTSSILGNQEPLWVVDGIIQQDPVNVDPQQLNDLDFVNLLGNAIAGLNPDDVEQIDVLKDAAATALYGVRAANGVIVITTKKGKVGPPTVSYSLTGSFSTRPRYSDKGLNLMNSKERVDVSREMMERGVRYSGSYNSFTDWIGYEKAYLDYFKNGSISFEEFQRRSAYYETLNTDWFDILCRDVFSHNHSLSISGGSASARYYASFGYADDKGEIRGEKNERYTASVRVTVQHNKLQMQFGMSGNVQDKSYNPSGLGIMNYAYNMTRTVPLYGENGELYTYTKNNNPFNIVREMEESEYTIAQKSASVNAQVQYRFSEAWKLIGTASYSMGTSDDNTWYGENSNYILRLKNSGNSTSTSMCPFGGELKTNSTHNSSYMLRLQSDYSRYWDKNKDHFTNASIGYELSSSTYNGTASTERGYYKDRGMTFAELKREDYSTYPDYFGWVMTNRPKYTQSLTNTMSAYLTLTYSYKDRYIFNVNTRADWSNAFGSRSNEKLLPVWSFSGRWNMTNDIVKNVSWINNLALRVSYGIQGNMQNDQPTRLIINKGGYNTSKGGYTSTISKFPNPDLKWEKTHSFNAGLDFSLLKNKIQGSVSWFYKKTIDAFLSKTVCNVNGVDTYVVNSGNVENKGIELSLNFNPINQSVSANGKRGFVWRFDPQIGQTLNKLLNDQMRKNDKTLKDELDLSQFLNGSVQLAGTPLNTFFSFKYAGLDGNGKPTFKDLEVEWADELNEKYKNMSKKDVWLAVLDESGTRVPVIQGGFSNYFAYRSFSLSVNFAYSIGNKIRLLRIASGDYSAVSPKPMQNLRREFVNRWRNPGDEKITDIPALQIDGGQDKGWWYDTKYRTHWEPSRGATIYSMYDDSDLRVVSGNYLRLQSLNFRYVLPKELLKKLRMSSGYLSLSGSNLFTWCSKELNGQSPEQSGTSSVVNISIRPRYSLSLNVVF